MEEGRRWAVTVVQVWACTVMVRNGMAVFETVDTANTHSGVLAARRLCVHTPVYLYLHPSSVSRPVYLLAQATRIEWRGVEEGSGSLGCWGVGIDACAATARRHGMALYDTLGAGQRSCPAPDSHAIFARRSLNRRPLLASSDAICCPMNVP